MPSKITRFYETATQGAKVAEHLAEEGFEHVFHFKASTAKGAAAKSENNMLVENMVNAHVWKSHAEAYAQRLVKGGALVMVHAPFGAGQRATNLMDSYAPVDSGLAEGKPVADMVWDDAAPLSSMLCLPVLTDIKLPFETLSGAASLSRGRAFLSDVLGLPLLKQGPSHKVSSFGIPLLSRSGTPLSSMLGLKLLSSRATPLSSLLGMKLLTRKQ
jgi:hypothetical protein